MLDMPYGGYDEPPFEVQIPDHPHPHQVRIWLPPSYHHTEKGYPTLWVTDNFFEQAVSGLFGSHAFEAPEVIVVAIGAPRDLPTEEAGRRRSHDFNPGRELLTWDDAMIEQAGDTLTAGGAEAFLNFVTGPLRQRVTETYRSNGDHALAGHSGGAMFALYSLFTRPDAFGKYLIGSPAAGFDLDRLEAQHHAKHGELSARVFLAAGGSELTDPFTASLHIVSTTASICERLVTRGYKDLDLHAAIYPGCSHTGIVPALFSDGLRWLWRDAVKVIAAP